MRAKFVSTTNLGLDGWIPKEVWGNLEITKMALWSDFSSEKYFHTSLVCSYVYNPESKILNLETANSEYVFRLEEDLIEEELKGVLEENRALVRLIRHQNKHERYTQARLRIGCYNGVTYDEKIILNPPMSYYEARKRYVGNYFKDEQGTIIGEVRFVTPFNEVL